MIRLPHRHRTAPRGNGKALYLNRTVVWVTMIGYISLMILLLFMDWYLIAEYQRENQEAGAGTLQGYMEETEEAMASVEGVLREVYLYDDNFRKLSDIVKNAGTDSWDLSEYNCVYELTQNLKNRMSTNEMFHGYYLFYRGFKRSYYGADLVNIKSDEARYLGQAVKGGFSSGEPSARSWTVLDSGVNLCLVAYYQLGDVKLFGVHSLENAEKRLEENLGKDVDVVFLRDSFALTERELAGELGLAQIAQANSDLYSGRLGNYYVYGQRLKNTDLWAFMTLRYGLWDILNLPQLLLLVAAIGSVFAVVGLLFFMKKELVFPLRELTDTMNHIRRDSSYQIPRREFRFHELQEVNDTFAGMISELEKQKLRTYEEVIERQKATMQYLQLQLKPHFYLNGLKTLNALAMENKTEEMQELILNLSAHLRYLLQTERETIPLHMEIDFVKNYVNLQRHVTGRPVECGFYLDEEVGIWEVPVLCVQTFVENSVKYARFGSVNALLQINVTAAALATEEGRFLDLVVEDNGQGYPKEILEEINGDPQEGGGSGSIGINNIKRRCQIIYGDRVEYNFYNDSGAVSELILPEMEPVEAG